MSKHGKKYREAKGLIEEGKLYEASEAVALVKKTVTTKFDSSIELHVHLGTDPKMADQIVRGSAVLPHGTGKSLTVVAFVTQAQEKEAKEAGATLVGGEELIKEIKQSEKTDFDVAVATPEMMPKLGQIARLLGQRGLMPNPKNETVTKNVAATIKDLMGGKATFRSDESANLHQLIGKASWDAVKLTENLQAFMDAVKRAKPDGAKGTFIVTVTLTSSMGPGIRVIV
ncbi:MAG: 50S ribosomal protein L1 [Patescibacteria group bacterium]|jgi:large subunit ribosomal protein L1